MAQITFSYTPSYEQNEKDVTLIEPEVTHTFTLPEDVTLSRGLARADIEYHFNMWLRGLGYYIPE